jgi:hypothetical protein
MEAMSRKRKGGIHSRPFFWRKVSYEMKLILEKDCIFVRTGVCFPLEPMAADNMAADNMVADKGKEKPSNEEI